MNYNTPWYPYNYYRTNQPTKSYKSLEEALTLIKEAIKDERKDELFYGYLISAAPTEEEKRIIASIRDDERKHSKFFKEIYFHYTREKLTSPADVEFEKPKTYIEGIRRAKFGELSAVEKYRDIMAGIPDRYYKDMVFEILTDELKHADKDDYILYLSLANMAPVSAQGMKGETVPPTKTSFTTEEAKQIARALGIDFSKEKFDVEQFRMGLDTELEHGRRYYPTNVTGDDPITTGKIAYAHLREFPDYYTRLNKLEAEAKAFWGMPRSLYRQTREFTLQELSQYDGSMGKPAYVAVNGIVYDVSNEATWGGGSHFGLVAGKDLTKQFQGCHGMDAFLAKLPKIGILV